MSTTTSTTTLQISCIRKRTRPNPHERIEGVGGLDGSNKRFYYLEDDAIRFIETGRLKFWTTANSKAVWIIVASHNGRKYLKTESDGYEPNNLLALPTCP